MLEEREFFVPKAFGWVLRDVSRRAPAAVVRWLSPRAARASTVTLREALKDLPPAMLQRPAPPRDALRKSLDPKVGGA